MRTLPWEFPPEPLKMDSVGANLTLAPEDACRTIWINATADIDVTLWSPSEGDWSRLYNRGTGVITLKNPGGTAIGTIRQRQRSFIEAWPDDSGDADWPAKILVEGASGEIYLEGDITFRNAAKGTVYKDAGDSTLIRVTADAGAQVTTDTGSTSEGTPDEPTEA